MRRYDMGLGSLPCPPLLDDGEAVRMIRLLEHLVADVAIGD
jgi:hypothetical protein